MLNFFAMKYVNSQDEEEKTGRKERVFFTPEGTSFTRNIKSPFCCDKAYHNT